MTANARTPVQIIRCWWLGSYRAAVMDGELKVRGPLPMTEDLQQSVRDRREELAAILEDYCGGTWPPLEGSAIHGREDVALDLLEIQKGAA